jgi:lipopolysaccharide assembly outer membrane protein LptD (OstA)
MQAGYSFQSGAGIIKQDTVKHSVQDTVPPIGLLGDSLAISDSLLKGDSLKTDSVPKKKKSGNDFKSPLKYSADSMTYSANYKRAYLFGNAKVNYEDIEVNAAYIDYDFGSNIVFAKAIPDSAGALSGKPVFKQNSSQFTSDSLKFNFKSKKGITYDTNTKEGDGYIIADITKKQDDGSYHLKGGKYTTCDAAHPHFYLALSKAVVIPNDKIVSGPAHLVVEDVHLPIYIPFGFFPNKKKAASGIIIPSYGESSTRGFYLTNGGYYFAISDYVDLKLTGDIYMFGTWGINANTNYNKRYKFRGSFTGSFKQEKTGEKDYDQTKTNYISIKWTHSQDAKASPGQTFSASVDYSSIAYDKNFNYLNRTALTTNTKTSSISYNRSWTNMSFTAKLGSSQSSSAQTVTFTLPNITFSVSQVYPFRGKNTEGDYKWYENIKFTYSANAINYMKSLESQVFSNKVLRESSKGFKHSIPLSISFKFLKYFTFTPSLNYSGVLYNNQFEKSWADTTGTVSTNLGKKYYYEKLDTIYKVSYGHGFTPATSLGFAPSFYGTIQFKKGSKIEAIRHVLTPSISVSFTPDLNFMAPNYYKTYEKYDTTTGTYSTVKYNIYTGTQYGAPSTIPTKSGTVSFSLANTLEMKVKSDKDTVTGTKKIKILESLNLSASYNMFADSMKLSTISFSASAPLVKSVKLSVSGTLDPYALDTYGTRINKYYWENHKSLGRITSASTSFGYTFQGGKGKDSGGDKKGDNSQNKDGQPSGNTDQNGENQNNPNSPNNAPTQSQPKKDNKPKGDYQYFSIPWSLSFNYSLQYSKPKFDATITQSLSFSGSMTLTPKWKVGFSSGYDFESKEFSYTTFNITRNLHCWTMSFDFAPFGTYRFYNFRISALSSILSDLKYEQRKDTYDY